MSLPTPNEISRAAGWIERNIPIIKRWIEFFKSFRSKK